MLLPHTLGELALPCPEARPFQSFPGVTIQRCRRCNRERPLKGPFGPISTPFQRSVHFMGGKQVMAFRWSSGFISTGEWAQAGHRLPGWVPCAVGNGSDASHIVLETGYIGSPRRLQFYPAPVLPQFGFRSSRLWRSAGHRRVHRCCLDLQGRWNDVPSWL